MAFGLSDDIATRVLVEETLGLQPNADTVDVPNEFRLKVRREVAAIKKAGGAIEVPNSLPAPNNAGGAVPVV